MQEEIKPNNEVPTQEETKTQPDTATSPEQSDPAAGTQEVSGQSSQKVTVSLDNEDHAEFLKWRAEARERHITKRIKEIGSPKVFSRRTTLVFRRSDCKKIAPDADIVAYSDIYGMKNPKANPKLKVTVTDNEIKAYLVLSPDFKTIPTMGEITAKVEEMTEAGELPDDGNNAGEAEETETEE